MSLHAQNRVQPRTARPHGARPQEFYVLPARPFGPFGLFCPFPFHPLKPLNFVHQNLRKTQQNPTSSTLVNPNFFLRPPPLPATRARRWKCHTSSTMRAGASTTCLIRRKNSTASRPSTMR